MKFKKLGRTVLSVLVIVSMLASIPVFAEEPEGKQQYTITEPYEYPCAPGTALWESTQNRQLRIDACQIPDEILKNMTTSALIDTILNYPYIMEMQMWNTYSSGYEEVKTQFNGLAELEKRDDAGASLLEAHEKRLLVTDESATVEQSQAINHLEILLAQDVYMTSLNNSEMNRLNNTIEEKRLSRIEKLGKDTSVFYSSLAQKGITTFAWDPSDDHSVTYVYTPNRLTVEVWSYKTELDDLQVKAFYGQVLKYPGAVDISRPTTKYNCHSYAWYKSSTSNTYWMNDCDAYITDGSYVERSYPVTGDIIYYYGSSDFHSGKVTNTAEGGPTIVSKWGPGCLVRHPVESCPFAESNLYRTYYHR